MGRMGRFVSTGIQSIVKAEPEEGGGGRGRRGELGGAPATAYQQVCESRNMRAPG